MEEMFRLWIDRIQNKFHRGESTVRVHIADWGRELLQSPFSPLL
jgi:hypothetical protein